METEAIIASATLATALFGWITQWEIRAWRNRRRNNPDIHDTMVELLEIERENKELLMKIANRQEDVWKKVNV